MKLFSIQHIPEGCRFPYDVLISAGSSGAAPWKRYYLQFQSPFRSLDTYKDFPINKEVTRWRRKTFRIVVYANLYKMSEE